MMPQSALHFVLNALASSKDKCLSLFLHLLACWCWGVRFGSISFLWDRPKCRVASSCFCHGMFWEPTTATRPNACLQNGHQERGSSCWSTRLWYQHSAETYWQTREWGDPPRRRGPLAQPYPHVTMMWSVTFWYSHHPWWLGAILVQWKAEPCRWRQQWCYPVINHGDGQVPCKLRLDFPASHGWSPEDSLFMTYSFIHVYSALLSQAKSSPMTPSLTGLSCLQARLWEQSFVLLHTRTSSAEIDVVCRCDENASSLLG